MQAVKLRHGWPVNQSHPRVFQRRDNRLLTPCWYRATSRPRSVAPENPLMSPTGRRTASLGKEANWWFRKWADPLGEHPETSLVDNAKRPYSIDGTRERYTFKVGNIRVIMMSDRNDLPYPVGRRSSGGASPAGAVTEATFAWWKDLVARARADNEIIISCHHHVLRETTVGSGGPPGGNTNTVPLIAVRPRTCYGVGVTTTDGSG
jgi:hypothetical protein